MTQQPSPPLGGDEAKVVAWHKMSARQPEPGHKFVALFDDGSGAWLGFAHDAGVIDSDGDDHTKMPNAEWWAYLPSGFRMACEDHPVEDYNLPDHVCPPLAAPVLPVERPFGLSPLERERIRSGLIAGLEKAYWAGSEVNTDFDALKEADTILSTIKGDA